MSSALDGQAAEFAELFLGVDQRTLFRRALEGRLRSSSIRSLAWRFFWNELPREKSPTAWPAHVKAEAAVYQKLAAKYCADPHESAEELDLSLSNPLSQDEASPWTR